MLRISQSAHAEVSLRKDGRDKVRGGEVVRGVGEERRRGKVVREGSAHAVVGAEHERDLLKMFNEKRLAGGEVRRSMNLKRFERTAYPSGLIRLFGS